MSSGFPQTIHELLLRQAELFGSAPAIVASDPIDYVALLAPEKTPPAVLARLRSGLAELRRTPSYQRQLRQLAYEAFDDSPEQFAAEIASDTERFADILKETRLASPP